MSATQSPPKSEPAQRIFRGSLAANLVRWLLIFTFIPLAIMAGAAYLRARGLLREQVIEQSQSLMNTQIASWELEIKTKEIRLDRLIHQGDFASQLELALHANPQSREYDEVR